MARLKVLRDFITSERYFQEPVTGINFRRIAAGMAWPYEERPGCAVVLGETRAKPNEYGTERHNVHKLIEISEYDASRLVELAASITEEWFVENWALPVYDKRACLVEDVNDLQRKRRRPQISYGDPLGFYGKGEGLLPFYHSLVQRRTANEKTLFLGEGSCGDELAAFNFTDQNTSIIAYPSAAALCFALAEIDLGDKACLNLNPDKLGPADDLGGY